MPRTRSGGTSSTTRRGSRASRYTKSYREDTSESSSQGSRSESAPESSFEDARPRKTLRSGKPSASLQFADPKPHPAARRKSKLNQRDHNLGDGELLPRKKRRTSSALSTSSFGSEQMFSERGHHATTKPQSTVSAAARQERQPTVGGLRNSPRDRVDFAPPWHTLPYHILLDIFYYAFTDIHSENPQLQSETLKKLGKISRLCKAFAEPAMAVLHYSPPIRHRAHAFLRHLKTPVDAMLINYRNKVRRLEMNVDETLYASEHGAGRLDLVDLVQQTPQLQDLELCHTMDRPPYRVELGRVPKWIYPVDLFSTMDDTGIRLRSWRWNTRMTGPRHALPLLRDIHQHSTFHDIRRLAFVNYPRPLPRSKDLEGATVENYLNDAISALPHLESLEFETCELVNEHLLHRLPDTLKSLSLINCCHVNADVFRPFLIASGRHLRHLTLHHNQSLNLTFLADLATTCPALLTLSMDLQFFDSHFFYKRTEPNFEVLMLPSDVPTWPSTIQVIELIQLRSWSVETAEMFFNSLIDSAPELLSLRRLVLKAILSISWRDRANFRDTWIRRIENIFLRDTGTPDPDFMSARTGEAPKNALRLEQISSGEDDLSRPARTKPMLGVVIPNGRSKSDSLPLSPRRSSRLRHKGPSEGHLSIDVLDDDSERKETAGGLDKAGLEGTCHDHQGLCDVVDVRIDDIRPMENQYREADFLDDEVSGDEDWNGEDREPYDDSYAW
ncbi:MAG: hypothetical protein M1833_006599 [Piccolia ochrophora]|nr:MAG: hypothetical protein M1833_006599 [Piccolia ochrophora]